jgi:hypothetical protein
MRLVSEYRVFSAEDVGKAKAYDDAMDSLSGSMQGVQFALGEALIPLLSTAADAFSDALEFISPFIEALGDVPGEVYLVVGAVGALNYALRTQLVAGAVSSMATALTGLGAVNLTSLGAGLASAAKAAGPLVILAGAIYAVTSAMKSAQDVRDFVSNVDNVTMSLEEQAKALEEGENWWNRFVGTTATKMQQIAVETRDMAEATLEQKDATDAQKESAQLLLDVMGEGSVEQQTNNLNTEAGTIAQQDYAEALSASAGKSQEAQEATRELADIIASGATNQQELADAVQASGEAQAEQNRITGESKGLMDAYAASTYDAVNATLALFDKQFAARDAQRNFNDEIKAYAEVMKDGKSTSDDQAEALDNLSGKALDVAASTAAAQKAQDEANGIYRTASDYTQIQIDKLKELEQQPGLSQSAITAIQDYRIELENAQEKAAAGINVKATADTAKAEKDLGVSGLTRPRTVVITPKLTAIDAVAFRPPTVVIPRSFSAQPAPLMLPQIMAPQPFTQQAAPVNQTWTVTINGAVDPRSTVRALERWVRDNGRPGSVTVTA